MIDSGANVNARDKDGNTALVFAAQFNDYAGNYAKQSGDIKTLIKAGADVNAQNKDA